MKIDTLMPAVAPPLATQKALEIEQQGYDCAWTFEAANDAFFPLAFAASATQTLEIGTNIAVAFARTPFAMAQTAWDLQRYSNGRLRLGLGTQVRAHVERRFSADFDHPAARVTDYIRCVRAIWDTFQHDAKPDYQGAFYRFKLMNPMFNPGPIDNPHIPIYLAGMNPRMCRAAGEVADGFHVHPMHSIKYLNEIVRPALDAGAKTRGKSVDDIELYAPVFVITGETPAETAAMEQIVRRQVSFYGSTPSYASLLTHHGFDELPKQLNTLMREQNFDEMARIIPDALLEEVAIICPPAALGEQLRTRYDGLLDRVSLYMTMTGDANFNRWDELIATVKAA